MIQETMFEPSDEDLYQRAISMPLGRKILEAIGLIELYEEEALSLSPEGYYVAFSGGKDSIVMAKLFEMSGVKYGLHYNNVTIDPPELVRFIRKNYPEAKWNNVGKSLPLYMENKSNGPPTRLSRWCCEVYKEQGGLGCFRAMGVRAEESARRKGLWRRITNTKDKGPVICPIIYWTEDDVWKFIRDNGMEYCSLYDEGFKRLGCVGCPLGGPKNQAREFARWPRYEALWKKGFQKHWDKWKGVPRRDGQPRWIEKFETVDDLWNWWVSGGEDDGSPDCQIGMW
ncbi:MAG: phosphoadenosine phosphosulfate reductase family protein [bacterium]|nr:phosphoadenosine phosphosulfate reductase family protein [bacterium]